MEAMQLKIPYKLYRQIIVGNNKKMWWIVFFINLKGKVHPKPKLSMFVHHLRIINTVLKNDTKHPETNTVYKLIADSVFFKTF